MFAKTVVILGAGGRGWQFGKNLLRLGHWANVMAVAEPRHDYRCSIAQTHQIAQDRVFNTWQEFCARPKLCRKGFRNVKDLIDAGAIGGIITLSQFHSGRGGTSASTAPRASRRGSRRVANATESLKTHTIVFAAETSRLEKRRVEISQFPQQRAGHSGSFPEPCDRN